MKLTVPGYGAYQQGLVMMKDSWMMEESDGILDSKDLFQRINGSKIFSDLDEICLATVTAVVLGMEMEGPYKVQIKYVLKIR